MTLLSRFAKNESGATAIEYALIAAIIGIGLLTILGTVGDSITQAFTEINSGLTKR